MNDLDKSTKEATGIGATSFFGKEYAERMAKGKSLRGETSLEQPEREKDCDWYPQIRKFMVDIELQLSRGSIPGSNRLGEMAYSFYSQFRDVLEKEKALGRRLRPEERLDEMT